LPNINYIDNPDIHPSRIDVLNEHPFKKSEKRREEENE
jgi:hypothetical protein